ncbi:MAG: hypothetical protein ACREP9_05480, partial [Candidatus Dormibacteraceae bacterium]
VGYDAGVLPALATALAGLGLTIASTFAPSLGLSLHQQRIGFAFGVLLIFIGGLLLLLHRRRNAKDEPDRRTPLEKWLQEHIDKAGAIERQRKIRGEDWYLGAMSEWDFENAQGMLKLAPDLVDGYRENPKSDKPDGFHPPHDMAEQERYYGQRLSWLRDTLKGLHAP